MQEFSFYNDIELEVKEVNILQELEDIIGEKIPFVKSAAMYNHGFSFENKKTEQVKMVKRNTNNKTIVFLILFPPIFIFKIIKIRSNFRAKMKTA